MATSEDPKGRPGRGPFLLAGLAMALAGSLLLAWNLWNRVGELGARLEASREREQRLGQIVEEANAEAAEFRELSKEAKERAEEAARLRAEAEWDRELARDEARRAETESEQARLDAERARQEYERIRDARERELDRMSEALGKIVETERTALGMVMRLGEESLQFDFDNATIREKDKELLSRIAGVLLASHGYRLSIFGHTDDQGPAEYNQELSKRRAAAVRQYFERAGIPPDIMESKGYGESSPRVPGSSATVRQKNRRVEIGVIDTVIDYEAELKDEPNGER